VDWFAFQDEMHSLNTMAMGRMLHADILLLAKPTQIIEPSIQHIQFDFTMVMEKCVTIVTRPPELHTQLAHAGERRTSTCHEKTLVVAHSRDLQST